ncbi:MAG: phosphoribosylanthranilate isomerase [Candidatus Gastranaerophilales bacterium]|nr:phosphoribosylanthranilate isomerase [Candidatus Gastranaerophilales bacterium]
MKIKFCGLQTIEDIYYINEAMPDFAGFIFAEKSKRKISYNQAFKMKKALNNHIKAAGVFVNEKIENIILAINMGIIDLIQLHGDENNDYIKELKSKIDFPVIKAIKSDSDIIRNINSTIADYILIDSYNSNSFGGTGISFDWRIIPKTNKKIFLAGGLNSENIIQAVKEVNPYCVDINSGVETNGKKDRNKIIEIIKIIKGYKNE